MNIVYLNVYIFNRFFNDLMPILANSVASYKIKLEHENKEEKVKGTDTHFFTNRDGVTTFDRFKAILSNNTRQFDVIVGYFFVTGFYKLWRSLEGVEKIRIIVGMGTDEFTYSSASGTLTDVEIKKEIKKLITSEFENSETEKEIEEGIYKFLEYLEKGKLEIRGYPDRKLHAKIYIMIKKEGSEDYGKVITGSSNFSAAGLAENLEFNVELKDKPDVEFAEGKFEELWKESIPLTSDFIKTIKNETYIKDDFTPYEIYLKTLYEYFKDVIDYDLATIDFPKEYKQFRYQVEAVLQAEKILKEHGGVFISDVVGLGKTYIASLLAKKLAERPIVVCPPLLMDYWQNVMESFGVFPKIISSGMLKFDKIDFDRFSKYKLIFIDEAHTFRNEDTESYAVLHELCAGKKVVLITATPLNNEPQDIASELYLFENKFNSTIPDLKNLYNFFSDITKEYKELKFKQKDSALSVDSIKSLVKDISNDIKNKVIKHLMVRRTRKDILDFYHDDIEKQGLTFPEVSDPEPLFYELDKKTDNLFEDSVKAIESKSTKGNDKTLTYARYKLTSYLKTDGVDYLWENKFIDTKDLDFEKMSEALLTGLMRTLFLKRLDSSFEAFRKTLANMLKSYEMLLSLYEKGKVPFSRGKNIIGNLARMDLDELEQKITEVERDEAVFWIPSEYFEQKFKKDLQNDINIIKDLKARWDKVTVDPKIDKMRELLLGDEILGKQKLIIFTEFEDTLYYLKEQFEKDPKLKGTFIAISSKSSKAEFEVAVRNFDPRNPKQEDKFRILISTDVFSQGLNLDKATAIVNYDIPWNPTRIIQRFGRINRVGSKGKIYIYNFFPTQKTENKIFLKAAATRKIEMFINTLGADSKYLTEFDTSNTTGIFDLMNKISTYEEAEIDPELKYLQEIRSIRDKNRELFEKIKHIPIKARATRLAKENKVITFFKYGNLPKFYLTGEAQTIELAPIDAFNMIKAKPTEPANRIPDFFYDMFRKNNEQFEQDLQMAIESDINRRLPQSTKKLLPIVNALINDLSCATHVEYLNTLKDALQAGAISQYIVKLANKKLQNVIEPTQKVKILLELIRDEYVYSSMRQFKEKPDKKVILSSVFKEGLDESRSLS
ncbi:helicase-related protein [Caldisericum sp. AR60]|uniref:helicase-related protein n=1 Tax=Caldisericum sp. AR60 TaxID=3397852 RepID=UPI0039FD3BE2